MPYYYDKNGEVILESMQDLYYKVGLMREDSRKEYELHKSLGIHSKPETSKLKKIIDNNKESN